MHSKRREIGMSIIVEPVKLLIGAHIRVDKARLCDDDVIEAVLKTLEERHVIVFAEIQVTDAEQLAFTDRLGDRVTFTRRVPGSDVSAQDVYKITLDKEVNLEPDYVYGTFFWHIDGVTMDIPLPKATVLSARTLAEDGGATEFANLFAAYEFLSAAEKREIEGLRVLHSIEASLRPVYGHPSQERLERWHAMTEPMEHPLVWRHADGRKSLLIGTHADTVIGWPSVNGRALLWRLQQWAAQPDFTYRHDWRPDDMVIWNNEGLMHRVIPYSDNRRSMHRTTIAGAEKPGHVASAEAIAKALVPAG
jgi:alpha-ketoglutarate-dependent taurine dioxygenase